MKLYVLSEHYGWAEEHSFEAAVLVVTDSRPQAEELAQQRIVRIGETAPVVECGAVRVRASAG